MATTINVNKQSVEELLGSGKNKPFIIPEYQRPYAWTNEQVETLFEDLWEFTTTSGGSERNGTYFLGCIVSYDNEEGQQEIIDGQQRVTSLFLLLRAIYTKLVKMPEKTKATDNFIKEIEPSIWKTNKLTGEVDYSSILLTSKVVNNEGNEILRNILETGTVISDADDNYSRNYNRFQSLFDDKIKSNFDLIYDFIYAVLNQAILLPITADSQDTALIIFNTLNSRGLPLSDADIFKAKIYNHLEGDEKNNFIEDWKNLDEDAQTANESIQSLFYYYMFYLRAKENDKSTTTPGIRPYFSADKYDKLYSKELMTMLATILNLWKVVNIHEKLSEEKWSANTGILKTLDILSSYPNEFWKYPVINFYLSHREEDKFEGDFLLFLNKLLSELLTKYCLVPTINAVKSDIMKLNVEIIDSSHPKFDFKEIEKKDLELKIKSPHRNAIRMLLKLLAYNHQNELLPERWEIEHIFPQKWQNTYFIDTPEKEVRIKIEHLGNKLPFEKKLNIIAGNGYFKKKKVEYSASLIEITKDFSQTSVEEWNMDNIIERDVDLSNEIITTLKLWNNNYVESNSESGDTQPTPEQLEQIKLYKEKGWI